MLYTVSFPITDYRELLNYETNAIDMFNNSRFDFGKGFLRSFGGFSNRYFCEEYISPDELIYAYANKGIHFSRQEEQSLGYCFRLYFDCVFRRAFFGPFSARFDIGLTNRFKYDKCSLEFIEKSVFSVLHLKVYTETKKARKGKASENDIALLSFGSSLKKAYLHATTKDPQKNFQKTDPKWLSARMPVIIVQGSYNEIDICNHSSKYHFREINLPQEWGIHLFYKAFENKLPLWVIIADKSVNKERLRALRIWLSKWHQEKQSFLAVMALINDMAIRGKAAEIDSNKVADCIEELLSSLGKKSQDGFPASDVANAIMSINRQVDPASEERLMKYLRDHESTKHLLGRTSAAMKNNFPFKDLSIVDNKPVVFISHTSPEEEQKQWVRNFASELENNNITTILDLNNLPYGTRIPDFMEQAINVSDYVFLICTPEYKEKADNRIGGVGYETSIITGEFYERHNDRKYIPIFPKGKREESTPLWAIGKKGVVLGNGTLTSSELTDLIKEIKKSLSGRNM